MPPKRLLVLKLALQRLDSYNLDIFALIPNDHHDEDIIGRTRLTCRTTGNTQTALPDAVSKEMSLSIHITAHVVAHTVDCRCYAVCHFSFNSTMTAILGYRDAPFPQTATTFLFESIN